MSKVICVMGESGSGKTTSMRNLAQRQPCILTVIKKVFPGKDGGHSIIQKIRITSKQTSHR